MLRIDFELSYCHFAGIDTLTLQRDIVPSPRTMPLSLTLPHISDVTASSVPPDCSY